MIGTGNTVTEEVEVATVAIEVMAETEVMVETEVNTAATEAEITIREVHPEAETEVKTIFLGLMVGDEAVTGITIGMPGTRTTKTFRTEETVSLEATTHTTGNSQTTSPIPHLLNKNDDGLPVNLRRAVKTPEQRLHPLNNPLKEGDST